jgi:hypothetical protein
MAMTATGKRLPIKPPSPENQQYHGAAYDRSPSRAQDEYSRRQLSRWSFSGGLIIFTTLWDVKELRTHFNLDIRAARADGFTG